MLPRTQRDDRETPELTTSATSLAKNEQPGPVAWGVTTSEREYKRQRKDEY
ncbi:uncharacterized protein LDX57_008435 [Aspergillus melleus]|uniref:uncharacterized protein n=1 Tax=Aspergillus melleus TaxID=138277 RepID=UPI001E8E1C89|nr:uncharacterized protein LDX57_008435 [Aspergillus melleus]KAH8430772.1 hypothetical protein LDX57_008435 [Aspergillus melleus]